MALAQTRQRALIVGLGKTGASVAGYLAARGYSVAVTDSRAQPPGLTRLRSVAPDAAVFLGGFSEQALSHADLVVLSPGVAPDEAFVQQARATGKPVLGDIELFAREVRAPVIAVTGSNGKSTVTTLVGLMAERAGRNVEIGGNLGPPALDLLDDTTELYVLELSSFQLESTESLHTVSAAVLNVTPDHMDRYASVKDYAAAKARIYRHCRTAVVNRDDPFSAAMGGAAEFVASFGLGVPRNANEFGVMEHAGSPWLARGRTALMPVKEVLIRGAHNTANALAALALGDAAGLPMETMLEILQEFRGLPHRAEFVAELQGVTYLNDSKGTNTGATLAAVRGFAQPLVLIAGGDGKGADFSELADELARRARAVVLIGRDGPLIAETIADRVPVEFAASMDDAVHKARKLAQAGDIVLLSPACASFDMFDNFEHRGQAFVDAVRSLTA